MGSYIPILLLFFTIPCLLGQQLRVAVILEEPMFFQLSNGSLAGIAHDTFQGVLQVLQNQFNRNISAEFVFVATVEDLVLVLMNNQAGFLPSLNHIISHNITPHLIPIQ
jgi:hypothetical protein